MIVQGAWHGKHGFGQHASGITSHFKQRVNYPMRHTATAIDRHGDRVDQERHVIMNDLHDGVFTDKSILGQRWVEYPYPRTCRVRRSIQKPPV